jgi:histidinol-phosphate aminotransferase
MQNCKPESLNQMKKSMISIEQLAAPGVRGLRPYEPGKPVEELERELGISGAIKLASNENPLGPSPDVLVAMQAACNTVTRYPDGNGFALKSALAHRLGVEQGQITLGNGSNDILELIARAFVMPDNSVVFSQHAFAVYPIVTQAVGAQAVIVPAKDWGNDLDAMAAAIRDDTRLVFIANPNNPTGTWLAGNALRDFIRSLPEHVIVVVDEAYFEYANASHTGAIGYESMLAEMETCPRLVVTRTFSKAYGLAGLRVGYGVSGTAVADYLNRVRQPFNLNSIAEAAAVAALADEHHLQNSIDVNSAGLAQLTAAFEAMSLAYINSAANFISVEVGEDGRAVYDKLLREGVIVRPVDNYAMPRHLRITVGTRDENARVIDALRKVLDK